MEARVQLVATHGEAVIAVRDSACVRTKEDAKFQTVADAGEIRILRWDKQPWPSTPFCLAADLGAEFSIRCPSD